MAVFSGISRLFGKGIAAPIGKTLTATPPGAVNAPSTPPSDRRSFQPVSIGQASADAAKAGTVAAGRTRRRAAGGNLQTNPKPTGSILDPVLQPKTLLGY